MKIDISLRLYLFTTVAVLASGLGIMFFSLTGNYYIEGLDTIMRASMLEFADEHDTSPKQKYQEMGFILSNNWQDMPVEIKQSFSKPPDTANKFKKYVLKDNPISRPKKVLFAMLVKDKQGKPEYVVKMLNPDLPHRLEQNHGSRMLTIMGLGFSVSLLFIAIMLLMIRSVTLPVKKLSRWIKQITPENIKQNTPDFRYSELQHFAQIIQSSLQSSQDSIEREQRFLSHASHELRTPITIIGNSTELLKRLLKDSSTKEQQVLSRIERAALTMKNLTQTLLWLSREQQTELPLTQIQLDQLICQSVQDHQYLLALKTDVKLSLKTQEYTVKLSSDAAAILIANLIRNAFQHTSNGKICITQNKNHLEITNPIAHTDSSDLGYGMGIYLCEKLAQHCGWQLEISNSDLFRVKVVL